MPFKTCPLNCIYCECGETTCLTSQSSEFVPTADVLYEIDNFLESKPDLDVVTFSGAGEPVLHSGIGEIINHLKDNYPYKVVLLTNGVLFKDPEIRKRVLRADEIIASLDAVSETSFKSILRPAEEISPSAVVEGLISLRKEYSGILVLEVFLVPGYNDTEEEIGLIKEKIFLIKPDRVQLNTLDRPGTMPEIKPVAHKKIIEIKKLFEPLDVETTGAAASSAAFVPDSGKKMDVESMIMASVERRPSTPEDLEFFSGISRSELMKTIGKLKKEGKIREEKGPRGIYYIAGR